VKKPTLNDVARIAGVSNATASRAISKPGSVSPKTRDAVEKAIQKSGYIKNQAASTLKSKSAGAILVLVPDIENTFFSTLLSGIEKMASREKISVLIASSNDDERTENEYLQYVRSGRADGAILLTGRLPQSLRDKAAGSNGPALNIVTASGTIAKRLYPHIGIDDVGAAKRGVEYLQALGHKDIAHVSGPELSSVTLGRLDGYHLAMKEAGLVEFQRVFSGDFTIESGERAAGNLLNMSDRPTAVFCANDEMAIGMISALRRNHVRVPQDISIMGFDDIHFAEHSIPSLTTIRQPRLHMGEQAMITLLAMLNNPSNVEPEVTLLDTELVIRKSTSSIRHSD